MRKVDSASCRYTAEGKPVHNHAGCYAEHHAHSLSVQQKQWLGRTVLHATPQPEWLQGCKASQVPLKSASRSGDLACVPSTTMTTRLIDDRKTPPSMAAAAHMAYRPGWMFQSGNHCISIIPMPAPKDDPTCIHPRFQWLHNDQDCKHNGKAQRTYLQHACVHFTVYHILLLHSCAFDWRLIFL